MPPRPRRSFDEEMERRMRDDGPRPQYYYFAHYALRSATFDLGAAAAGVLLSPDKDRFLRDLWEHVTEGVKEQEPTAPLDPVPPSIEVLPLKAGNVPIVVLVFPPPKGMTECHLIGLVLHFDPAKNEKIDEQTKVSFFTLELGQNETGAPRTVLCEWTKEGAHLNFGDGPPADPQQFADVVAGVLAGRPPNPKRRLALRPTRDFPR